MGRGEALSVTLVLTVASPLRASLAALAPVPSTMASARAERP